MSKTDGFYPGETVTVFTRHGRPAYVATVVDIEPCDRLRLYSEELGEETTPPALFVAHGDQMI